MAQRASRALLGALLGEGRTVEVDGVEYMLVVPSAHDLNAVRKLAVSFRDGLGDRKPDELSQAEQIEVMGAWNDLAAAAVAATLLLEGEDLPVGDRDLASRYIGLAGGEHGPLVAVAAQQCGIDLNLPSQGGEEAAAWEDAAEGDPF